MAAHNTGSCYTYTRRRTLSPLSFFRHYHAALFHRLAAYRLAGDPAESPDWELAFQAVGEMRRSVCQRRPHPSVPNAKIHAVRTNVSWTKALGGNLHTTPGSYRRDMDRQSKRWGNGWNESLYPYPPHSPLCACGSAGGPNPFE